MKRPVLLYCSSIICVLTNSHVYMYDADCKRAVYIDSTTIERLPADRYQLVVGNVRLASWVHSG